MASPDDKIQVEEVAERTTEDKEENFDDAVEDGGDEEEDEEIPIDQLRVVDLRFALKLRGLDTKGVKAVLIKRLEDAIEEEKKNPPKNPPEADDKSDPSLEELEKKLNQARTQRERKEQQLAKVAQQLNQEEEKLKLIFTKAIYGIGKS